MKRFGKTERLYERICDPFTIETAMRKTLIKHKYPHMRKPELSNAQKYMIAHWDECKEIVRRTLTSESYKFHELHSFKDIKGSEIGEFGIPKVDRTSVTELIGTPICFDDAKIVQISSKDEETGEEIVKEKLAVKFRHAENNEPVGVESYFISGSPSLRDRLLKVRGSMPFIGTIVKHGNRKKYYAIE